LPLHDSSKLLMNKSYHGAASGIRTQDPRFTKAML
jgi:hypothetical protein